MNNNYSRISAVFVDDQTTQLDDTIDNLRMALSALKCELIVLERFEDHVKAVRYLQIAQGNVDLVVTDVLWPSAAGEIERQRQAGLEVVRYAGYLNPRPLIVALSLGDLDHRYVKEYAYNAGADIFRFHGYDLPGNAGQGWIDLAEAICTAIEMGPPYTQGAVQIEPKLINGSDPAPAGQMIPDRRLKTKDSDTDSSSTVFIVHGHDDLLKEQVARFLQTLKLNAVILAEQPSRGNTLIESLEYYGQQADYAVVLLTADDAGCIASGEPSPRARQNVILELGYFIALLGRGRVRALYEEGVELPTDVGGWVYTALSADWKSELVREMKAAGIGIDANDLYKDHRR